MREDYVFRSRLGSSFWLWIAGQRLASEELFLSAGASSLVDYSALDLWVCVCALSCLLPMVSAGLMAWHDYDFDVCSSVRTCVRVSC